MPSDRELEIAGSVSDVSIHSPPEKIIEGQLDERIKAIEDLMDGDVISFVGSLLFGCEGVFRDEVEGIAGTPEKKQKLVVVLETAGGYIEVVQRIAETLRHHYERVEFVVPSYAMSAGTVLVMSGDSIYMDYFSILGPIDPQVENASGTQVPALGYLIQFDRLLRKADKGTLNTAELTLLVEKFDPADLYRYEQARELSISLLKEWLVRYKFRNWRRTETKGTPVNDQMRKRRAQAIAKKLSDSGYWHSHGRGISMEVLRRDLNLRIEDFGEEPTLSESIRLYGKLLRDYMSRLRHAAVLHRRGSYVPLAYR